MPKGKGRLTLTGQLGEVMKESVAGRAMSGRAADARRTGIKDEVFAANDLHVHVPEGAIPKDGPSAGITMATRDPLGSSPGRPVRGGLAMTGEITLARPWCCPSAASRRRSSPRAAAHIETVVCPKLNKKDLDEVPAHLRRGMAFHLVEDVEEVLALALVPPPDAEGPHGHEDAAAPLPGDARAGR